MKEIYVKINGYEDYWISNRGNIKSNKTGILKDRVKSENNMGYLYVPLSDGGKVKNYLIHRLVAEHFIPNPENYKEINHKDEDPKNNNVENLEWCDRKYNINYGGRIERQRKSLIEGGKKCKSVIQLKNGEIIKEWNSIKEASENGYITKYIIKCCKGKKKTYRGYEWCYKDMKEIK